MSLWMEKLRHNPVPAILEDGNKALHYMIKRDLFGQTEESVKEIWELPEPRKLLVGQQENGSWRYPNPKLNIRSQENYDQLETFRILGILVEKYGFTREHRAMERAAEYLLKFQTEEGDIRGIMANQYTPYYTAAMMELLIKAGYDSDDRIEAGFNWLLNLRQNDGGWALPVRTLRGDEALTLSEAMKTTEPIKPDRSQPFSHMVTGVVLRAFAAHPKHQKDPEAIQTARLLKSRFFQPDKYPDRRAPSFWTSFSYPFWFTDLLSSLDSLSHLGFSSQDQEVKNALAWFQERQETNGLWKLKLLRGSKRGDLHLWLSFAVSRVFKNLCQK